MDKNKVFLDKSMEFKEVGDSAYREHKYNSFVNRYYYSLYQKIIYIEKTDVNYSKYLIQISKGNNGSHEKSLYAFIDYVGDNYKKYYNDCCKIRDLKDIRQEADYTNKSIDDKKAKRVLRMYELIDKIFHEIIKMGDENEK